MFNFFKKEKTNQLYPELKPGERIVRLIREFLEPELTEKGFIFSERKMQFNKVGDFFEYQIYFPKSRHNSGDECVKFDVILSVSSPKYAGCGKKILRFIKKTNRIG